MTSRTDPYIESVNLLLWGDGTNGATTITDSSYYNRVPSLNTVNTTSNGASRFDTSSIYFPGTGPIRYASTSAFDLNIANWTWEMWYYELAGSNMSLVSRRITTGTSGWVLHTGGVRGVINGVWSNIQMTMTRPSLNQWHHIAWVKTGTVLAIYVDGAMTSSISGVSTIHDDGGALNFGQADQTGENRFVGFMENVRWTPYIGRYNTNFTPPSHEFPNYAGEISGKTIDSYGNPIATYVRAYRRDTGVQNGGTVLSSAVTGEYIIYAIYPNQSYVLFYNNARPYNAIIQDRINIT